MAKRIKVLFTIPNFHRAGSGKVVYDLVNGLNRRQFAPEILVKKTEGEFFNEVEQLGVPIHVYNYEAKYSPLLTFPLRIIKISNYLKSLQVDMIHSWHYSSDFSEALAARLAGINYIYTKKSMSWGNKAWHIKSRLSDHIVTINTAMKSLFFKSYNNITYIPVGIDTKYYQPRARLGEVEELDLKEKFVIITVANMVPIKGIEILIKAFKKLSNSIRKETELLLVGDYKVDYGAELKKLSKGFDNIHFLGKKMDVRPYLAEADVFVISTLNKGRKEAQGIAPLEAMAMGIPVIASNLEGLRDIMKGNEEFLFQPGSVKDLKNKLLLFINENLKEKNNKPEFPFLFTKARMIQSHEELYKYLSK